MGKKKSTSSVPLGSVSTSLWCCCGMLWCWCANLVWSSYLFLVLVSLRTIYLIINMYFEKKNRERIVIGKKMWFSFFPESRGPTDDPKDSFLQFHSRDQIRCPLLSALRAEVEEQTEGMDTFRKDAAVAAAAEEEEGHQCSISISSVGPQKWSHSPYQSLEQDTYPSHPTTAAAGEGSPRGRASSLIPSHRALPALG